VGYREQPEARFFRAELAGLTGGWWAAGVLPDGTNKSGTLPSRPSMSQQSPGGLPVSLCRAPHGRGPAEAGTYECRNSSAALRAAKTAMQVDIPSTADWVISARRQALSSQGALPLDIPAEPLSWLPVSLCRAPRG
jgi:hypothetical protein